LETQFKLSAITNSVLARQRNVLRECRLLEHLEDDGMKRFHSPEEIAAPVGNGYTHAITAGGAIYVSGQIGMEPSGNIADGFEAQAQCAFENP
jgi:enamine deaminase RidA (YjgF/YER057c/UK114 family)